ncbi:hypothetical protein KFK09_002896 [Dendrobium nobile]|uniref:Uncharacterized protein n=1 Tax=Dendrobium nobile TaxID=94219 RepID=A0A8T3C2M6_DENNO|nr:hypothetical protein KFK09_002896 [Dendrobium nobile]
MEGEEDGVRLMEEVAVLDFDMLCAAVALQTQGVKVERRLAKEEEEDHGDAELGGVQRMWEGGVLGCLEDRRIAMEAACCPCCRFGSNMGRAGLGPCFLQESRTLEMNNVQDGIWHGRGDTICIGKYGEGSKEFKVLHKPSLTLKKNPESCNMERTANGSGNHSWNVDISPSKPLSPANYSG